MTATKPHSPNSLSFEVCVPGSTSNLGAGFDCFGLALKLYLRIRATITPTATYKCRSRSIGSRDSRSLPRNETNLIYRAMSFVASREGLQLPAIRLAVNNEIPLGSGLGSSAAAIVGGIKLCGLVAKHELSDETILNYASEFEGHPDNVSASLHGGMVINSIGEKGKVCSLRYEWPTKIKLIVVSPYTQLPTHVARAALPRTYSRSDAVFNLQRSALFIGALSRQRYDLFWEAMRDRLHQPYRESLVPGLKEALTMKRSPGLLGVALSGAGPSIVALADDQMESIGQRIADCFNKHGVGSEVRILEVDTEGCRIHDN